MVASRWIIGGVLSAIAGAHRLQWDPMDVMWGDEPIAMQPVDYQGQQEDALRPVPGVVYEYYSASRAPKGNRTRRRRRKAKRIQKQLRRNERRLEALRRQVAAGPPARAPIEAPLSPDMLCCLIPDPTGEKSAIFCLAFDCAQYDGESRASMTAAQCPSQFTCRERVYGAQQPAMVTPSQSESMEGGGLDLDSFSPGGPTAPPPSPSGPPPPGIMPGFGESDSDVDSSAGLEMAPLPPIPQAAPAGGNEDDFEPQAYAPSDEGEGYFVAPPPPPTPPLPPPGFVQPLEDDGPPQYMPTVEANQQFGNQPFGEQGAFGGGQQQYYPEVPEVPGAFLAIITEEQLKALVKLMKMLPRKDRAKLGSVIRGMPNDTQRHLWMQQVVEAAEKQNLGQIAFAIARRPEGTRIAGM